MKKWLLALMLLVSAAMWAQSDAITLGVTDADGQSWASGTWKVDLINQSGFPGPPFYQLGTTTPVANQHQSGTLNNSGLAVFTITQNSQIAPAGTIWNLQVCPAATAACYTQQVTATGASQIVSLTPPAIRINVPLTPLYIAAYTDTEVQSAPVGFVYYNLISQQLKFCQTTTGCNGSGFSFYSAQVNTGIDNSVLYELGGVAVGGNQLLWNPSTNVLSAPTISASTAVTVRGGRASYEIFADGASHNHTGTTTDDVIYSAFIPAGALGSNGSLIADVYINIGSQGATQSAIRLYYGGQQQGLAINSGLGTIIHIRFRLFATNSTGNQKEYIEMTGPPTSYTGLFAGGGGSYTVDSTILQTLTINWQNGANSDNQTFIYAVVQVMP